MSLLKGRLVGVVVLMLLFAVLLFTGKNFWSSSMTPLKMSSYPSPNFDERPEGVVIDTVVLHATERDSAEEVIKIFQSEEYKVSSHYTIDRDGSILRHIDDEKRAWHAGVSLMPDGRQRVNDFSIGIELVNRNDGVDPYPILQLRSLSLLLRELKARHPLRYFVTHRLIAQPPGRKSDPAGLSLSALEIPKELEILG